MTPVSRPTRRSLLAAVPLAISAGPTFVRALPATPSLPFLAVGDWGRNGASHQRDVASQMARAASDLATRFVVSVGDNFYENGVQTAHDPQWKTSFEDIYAAPALQTPWYVVLGNHDYRGVPQAQLDYATGSRRWILPNRYYKIDGASIGAPFVDLFFIDSSPLVNSYRSKIHGAIADNVRGQSVPQQLSWLDEALGRSGAAWKIVFGHHTIYSGGSEHGNTPELLAQVKPLLERHGVQAYVNGHEHDLQHIRVGAIDYICTGAGSEVRPTGAIPGTRFCLSRSGFAAFRVDRDRLDLEFRDFQGQRVYGAVIPRERTALAA